jgi:hypothetical protein
MHRITPRSSTPTSQISLAQPELWRERWQNRRHLLDARRQSTPSEYNVAIQMLGWRQVWDDCTPVEPRGVRNRLIAELVRLKAGIGEKLSVRPITV